MDFLSVSVSHRRFTGTGIIINSVSDKTAESHVNDCRQGKQALQNIIFLSNLICTEILKINLNERKADCFLTHIKGIHGPIFVAQ